MSYDSIDKHSCSIKPLIFEIPNQLIYLLCMFDDNKTKLHQLNATKTGGPSLFLIR